MAVIGALIPLFRHLSIDDPHGAVYDLAGFDFAHVARRVRRGAVHVPGKVISGLVPVDDALDGGGHVVQCDAARLMLTFVSGGDRRVVIRPVVQNVPVAFRIGHIVEQIDVGLPRVGIRVLAHHGVQPGIVRHDRNQAVAARVNQPSGEFCKSVAPKLDIRIHDVLIVGRLLGPGRGIALEAVGQGGHFKVVHDAVKAIVLDGSTMGIVRLPE